MLLKHSVIFIKNTQIASANQVMLKVMLKSLNFISQYYIVSMAAEFS